MEITTQIQNYTVLSVIYTVLEPNQEPLLITELYTNAIDKYPISKRFQFNSKIYAEDKTLTGIFRQFGTVLYTCSYCLIRSFKNFIKPQLRGGCIVTKSNQFKVLICFVQV